MDICKRCEDMGCVDCAHWDSDDGVKGYCNGFNLVYRKYDADYYCATAERKPDEH